MGSHAGCHPSVKIGFSAIIILFLTIAPEICTASLENDDCFDCHGSEDILTWSPEEISENTLPAKKPRSKHFIKIPDISDYVNADRFSTSVHGDLLCVDCHLEITSTPHRKALSSVKCEECHEEEGEEFAKSKHGLARKGDKSIFAPGCADCHGAHYIDSVASLRSPVYHGNLPATCGRCHGNSDFVRKAGIAVSRAFSLYERSIHGRAIREKGLIKAANCVDCHGSHSLLPASDPGSSVYRGKIPGTCAQCHYGIYVAYIDSVHGKAVKEGLTDAPVCTDCHGEHEIEPASVASSYVSPVALSTSTCPRCHDSVSVVRKFGIPAGRTRSYSSSYHGLAIKLGDYKVANCASCHGAHGIYPSSDARSTVFKGNLKITCGQCHPGATDKFASGTIHGVGKGIGEKVKGLVKNIYILLIVFTIGFMVIHNSLDFVKKLSKLHRKRKEEKSYERMNRIERWEHLLMIISFFGLVITGFALKFSWSIPILAVGINEFLRSFLHRAFALIMVAVCLHHLGYIIFDLKGRKLFKEMIPTLKDVKDMMQAVGYYLGMVEERPRFGRYGYVEKLEYFALIWGSVVMILTGFILWFEEESMRLLPMWGFEVATIIHYYEAILATLAIIVWHLYFVMVNPDVAPMSFTWIDGQISHHHMELEHPLELEEREGRRHGEK